MGRDAWFVACVCLAVGLAVGATRWSAPPVRLTAIAGGCVAAAVAITARQNGFTAVAPVLVCLAVPAIELLRERRGAEPLTRRRKALAASIGR